MNGIWLALILAGIGWSVFVPAKGPDDLQQAIFAGAEQAAAVAFGLVGLLAFWSGLMRVAEEAGLTRWLARLLAPVVRPLFPSVPPGHPVMGSILLSIAANALGIGNAATPLGIKAMEGLQELNRGGREASDAMCTFVALTASGLTVVPGTVIALRAAHGSAEPAVIVVGTVVATGVSTFTALIVDALLRGRRRRR